MPRTKQPRIKVSDQQAMGVEPTFNGPIDRYDLMRALNWYNYYFSIKDSKKWVLEYMKQQKYPAYQIKAYGQSSSAKITQTWASIARMLTRGAVFENNLTKHIDEVVSSYVDDTASVQTVSKRPENGLIADLDDLLDVFYRGGYKASKTDLTSIRVGAYGPAAVKAAMAYYRALYDELQLIATDKVVAEGYQHLTTRQVGAYIKFVESIVNMLQGTVTVKTRTPRKPRRKKVKTVDQQLKAFKYAASSAEVDAVSVDPEKVIGASVLWTYNTKYRMLTMFVAKDGGFSVKGTTLQNVDADKCFAKKLRKPKDIIQKVMSDGKAKIAKEVKALSTKESTPNHRINENTLLLRVFK